jgi:hypothetical protein
VSTALVAAGAPPVEPDEDVPDEQAAITETATSGRAIALRLIRLDQVARDNVPIMRSHLLQR